MINQFEETSPTKVTATDRALEAGPRHRHSAPVNAIDARRICLGSAFHSKTIDPSIVDACNSGQVSALRITRALLKQIARERRLSTVAVAVAKLKALESNHD